MRPIPYSKYEEDYTFESDAEENAIFLRSSQLFNVSVNTKISMSTRMRFSLVSLAYNITVYHCSIIIQSLTNALYVSGISYSINFIELRDTDVNYRVNSQDAYVSLGSYFVNEMFIQWCYFKLAADQRIKYPEQLVSFRVLKTLSIVSSVRTVEDYYKFDKIPCNCEGALKI